MNVCVCGRGTSVRFPSLCLGALYRVLSSSLLALLLCSLSALPPPHLFIHPPCFPPPPPPTHTHTHTHIHTGAQTPPPPAPMFPNGPKRKTCLFSFLPLLLLVHPMAGHLEEEGGGRGGGGGGGGDSLFLLRRRTQEAEAAPSNTTTPATGGEVLRSKNPKVSSSPLPYHPPTHPPTHPPHPTPTHPPNPTHARTHPPTHPPTHPDYRDSRQGPFNPALPGD